jgi:hypothetical protein
LGIAKENGTGTAQFLNRSHSELADVAAKELGLTALQSDRLFAHWCFDFLTLYRRSASAHERALIVIGRIERFIETGEWHRVLPATGEIIAGVTVEEYADVLRSIKQPPYEESTYVSRSTGNPGYRVVYQVGRNWYWYTVSNSTKKFPPSEVADAISKGTVNRAGPYKGDGFEATIRFDGHSYMINMGAAKPR